VELYDVQPGMRVKVTCLHSTRGMLIATEDLNRRRLNATGTVQGFVPGHGGDVWWVQHDTGEVAPYSFDEIDPEDDAPFVVVAGGKL